MAIRTGKPPQPHCNTITSIRGISPHTRKWLDLITSVTDQTRGEVINEAVEAYVVYLATSTRLSARKRAFVLAQLVPLLRILAKPTADPLPEMFENGGGI